MITRRYKLFLLSLFLIFPILSYVIFYKSILREEIKEPKQTPLKKQDNLRSFYIEQNSNFELKNVKFLKNVSKNNALVILVQIHNRFDNLKILIESLRFTTFISNAIIVFSRDFVDPSIDNAIGKLVDFAAVILILLINF